MSKLLHQLITDSAALAPQTVALRHKKQELNYGELASAVNDCARGLVALGLSAGERVGVYLPKQPETVTAMFGAAAAGGVFVPLNPVLKGPQVGFIMRDCNVRILITSAERVAAMAEELEECHDLRQIVVVSGDMSKIPLEIEASVHPWEELMSMGGDHEPHRRIDMDIAAILYTSGSTGKPKGVVLSHRNMVAGAHAVASYLENRADDRLLAVLPFSFDYGFSQLSTAFSVGASVVLMDYLLPRDVIRALERERITGLAAVPPLWNQLSQLDWPAGLDEHLRYITNSGGAMPLGTLQTLRDALPKTRPYLMYGLTEAFRSTYLPPEEVDKRPDSMGKAIPNAEVMVVREDGSECGPGEPGELVHRGALVAMGYWNDPQKTAERFKPAPGQPKELPIPEMAVWSGDQVRKDEEDYLYFVGRKDEMIKTSGYRVSPTEVEEVVYGGGNLSQVVALGLPHPMIGQAILVIAQPGEDMEDADHLMDHCRRQLPNYMVPTSIIFREILPRNANGKIDRAGLKKEYENLFLDDEASE